MLVHSLVGTINPGTEITLLMADNKTHTFLSAGFSAKPRGSGGAGTSSPQWVDRMVITEQEVPTPSTASQMEVLGCTPIFTASCTGASRATTLIVVDGQGVPTGAAYIVDLLATKGTYDLDNVKHCIKHLTANIGSIDPLNGNPNDAASQLVKEWRVMSGFCEVLYANFASVTP